jgi:hypothetical protein
MDQSLFFRPFVGYVGTPPPYFLYKYKEKNAENGVGGYPRNPRNFVLHKEAAEIFGFIL